MNKYVREWRYIYIRLISDKRECLTTLVITVIKKNQDHNEVQFVFTQMQK